MKLIPINHQSKIYFEVTPGRIYIPKGDALDITSSYYHLNIPIEAIEMVYRLVTKTP